MWRLQLLTGPSSQDNFQDGDPNRGSHECHLPQRRYAGKPKPDSCTLLKSSANKLPLEDKSVQMVVTSPPYFGLRTYHGSQNVEWSDGSTCPFGNEKSVQEYVNHSIEVLGEIRRVLKDDGVVFWNVGDSYFCNKRTNTDLKKSFKAATTAKVCKGKPTKNLCLIPERVAIAAQDDGWIVRSIIIWQKPNATPESVKDRPTSSYEPIIMLTKRRKYYWNAKEAAERAIHETTHAPVKKGKKAGLVGSHGKEVEAKDTRNLRNVWTINTQPYSEAHFAVFPQELPRRCIKAASNPGDIVLDPFGGSGTTGKVAVEQGRKAILADINYGEGGSYEKLASARIAESELPLLDPLAKINASTMQDRQCLCGSERSPENPYTTQTRKDIAAVLKTQCLARPRHLRHAQSAILKTLRRGIHGKKTQQEHNQPTNGRLGAQRGQPKNGSTAERRTSELKEDAQLPKTRRESGSRKDGIEMKGIMETEIQPGTAASPEEAAGAYQTEQEVIARIKELRDDSLEANRLEFGRLFKQLQKIYARSGRHGRFTKHLEELGFARTTVYRWIDEYTSQGSHRKSEDRAIQPQSTKLSQMGRLGTQTHQDHGLIAKSCGNSDDANDVWQGFTDRSPSADAPGTDVGESTEAEKKVNYLDTTEGRSEWLFKHALDVFERANRASGQALHEWDEAAARVRKVLASYKRDEVDNPHADFSPISVGEEE